MTENTTRTQSAVAAMIAAVVLILIGTLGNVWPIMVGGVAVLVGAVVVLAIAKRRAA